MKYDSTIFVGNANRNRFPFVSSHPVCESLRGPGEQTFNFISYFKLYISGYLKINN